MVPGNCRLPVPPTAPSRQRFRRMHVGSVIKPPDAIGNVSPTRVPSIINRYEVTFAYDVPRTVPA